MSSSHPNIRTLLSSFERTAERNEFLVSQYRRIKPFSDRNPLYNGALQSGVSDKTKGENIEKSHRNSVGWYNSRRRWESSQNIRGHISVGFHIESFLLLWRHSSLLRGFPCFLSIPVAAE
jgi:hypothetical protein